MKCKINLLSNQQSLIIIYLHIIVVKTTIVCLFKWLILAFYSLQPNPF